MIASNLPYAIRIVRSIFLVALILAFPLTLAVYVLGITDWDLSVPLLYGDTDHIWQLALNKVLYETGWVLANPYLGAPEVASWHHNASAQTSALHSVLMSALSPFVQDSVQMQQIYYLLNFPLICLTSFIACRLLGIARLPAFCVGLLFAFTKFRIDEMLYSYLPNYFMVPLALVAVIWILTGRFTVFFKKPQASSGWWRNVMKLACSRDFALGLVFIVLTAVSDGYYAFFTLLLLGFAFFARTLAGDWRRPASLIPVGAYIVVLLSVATLLQLPLHAYKKAHWNEFYPNGIQDPALIKHSFEAEVYSSSLKLLIAPNEDHHFKFLGNLGKRMVETSDEGRRFKRGNYWPLGALGSLLFAVALTLLALPNIRRKLTIRNSAGSDGRGSINPRTLGDALLSLTLFIFLASIAGGIGTLVALVFPTIRAYDRFPVFLIFVLYIGAAWFVTLKLRAAERPGRSIWAALIVFVTAAALYDQIPSDSHKGNESTKEKFLAERNFVRLVETALPPGAMVYQYPYSQYLSENKHYGWGSFAHIRLYLHSHDLRWSNGGAKNSPADDWNFRISQLPLDKLITEVEAVGFGGVAIDRSVLSSTEYEDVRRTFTSRGYEIHEDVPSKYTFVRLRDPGFQLIYDPTYHDVDRIVVTDPGRLMNSDFPRFVNGETLRRYADIAAGKSPLVITKLDHPEIFIDGSVFTRGQGQSAIAPISEMQGQLSCELDATSRTLSITLKNGSSFDWKLGHGPFPIGIGVHLIHLRSGELLRWDNGFRVSTEAYIKKGASLTIRLPLDTLIRDAKITLDGPLVAEFGLVQDGNAWFNNVSCKVPLAA